MTTATFNIVRTCRECGQTKPTSAYRSDSCLTGPLGSNFNYCAECQAGAAADALPTETHLTLDANNIDRVLMLNGTVVGENYLDPHQHHHHRCEDSSPTGPCGHGAHWVDGFVQCLSDWEYHRDLYDACFCPCTECGGSQPA